MSEMAAMNTDGSVIWILLCQKKRKYKKELITEFSCKLSHTPHFRWLKKNSGEPKKLLRMCENIVFFFSFNSLSQNKEHLNRCNIYAREKQESDRSGEY